MERRGTVAYLVVLGVLLVGAVLCLVGSGMSWGTAQRADLAVTEVAVAGGDLLPLGRAVGLLGLAAVVAVHATRGWGRRVVGIVLAAAGAAVVVLTFAKLLELSSHVLQHLEGPTGSSEYAGASAATGGPLVMAAGGAAVAAAGLAIAVLGPRWPSMGVRYERRAAARPVSNTSERAAWDALDRGEDPTI
ncbi:MAG TPA: Trp biosynthesis-associated membrane protein [Jiangellaceae bacterium]|nr:Trp biosynthesis-associated membrane protein [Jiangellaceae bacterium]